MLGYKIISKSQYKELKRVYQKYHDASRYHYWFSGWPHVCNLIYDLLNGNITSTNVWEKREEFAREMNTDRYGKTKDLKDET